MANPPPSTGAIGKYEDQGHISAKSGCGPVIGLLPQSSRAVAAWWGTVAAMKLLVATHATQGTVAGDFQWVPEGELVAMYGFVCHDWQGACGCGRSFSGLSSHRGGTSALVTDSALDREQFRDVILQCLEETGWLRLCTDEVERAGLVEEVICQVEDVVASFPEGTVISRRVHGSANDPGGLGWEEYLARPHQ